MPHPMQKPSTFLDAIELLNEKLDRDGFLPMFDADDASRGTNEDRWQDMS